MFVYIVLIAAFGMGPVFDFISQKRLQESPNQTLNTVASIFVHLAFDPQNEHLDLEQLWEIAKIDARDPFQVLQSIKVELINDGCKPHLMGLLNQYEPRVAFNAIIDHINDSHSLNLALNVGIEAYEKLLESLTNLKMHFMISTSCYQYIEQIQVILNAK